MTGKKLRNTEKKRAKDKDKQAIIVRFQEESCLRTHIYQKTIYNPVQIN